MHFGEEADGNTLVVMSRKFTTEDSNDRPILLTGLKQTSLLFAFGAEDTLAYHSNNRVKKKVDLSTGTSGEKEAFVARLESTAGMSYIDLRFNAATTPSQANGINTDINIDPSYRVPASGGREILSNSRTEYWEYCFATSSHPGWSAHAGKALVGFNGILDDGASRPDLVHHSVLYAYSGDNCKNDESIIWVGGVNFYEELPANVGMSFDRFKSFRIQVHYDNPKLETGLMDNSGIRIWLDATAREHEAGTIQLGDPRVQLSASGKTIPPGKSMWEFACPSSVTSNWHKITVFSQILHMHQTGDMMYLEVKDSNGVVKRPNAVEYFDFAWQDPTLVEPFEIKPGDELITRCYFNNQGNTPVPFGPGSDQEMCIDFIFVSL